MIKQQKNTITCTGAREWKCNWSFKSNWLCVLVLIVFEWLTRNCVGIAVNTNTFLANFAKTEPYVLQNAIKLFRAISWIALIFLFSRSRSIRQFWGNIGLQRRPTMTGWGASWIAIVISLIDRYGATRNWTSPNTITRGFFHEGGGALLFYLIFVVTLGPFYEEIAFRGFLYSGFRCKYQRIASTLLVVFIMAYFHFSAIAHSLWTAYCLLSLWILICIMQEYTRNLWNSILCHAAYNAAAGLPFLICAITMGCMLFICIPYNRRRGNAGETASPQL